MMARETGMELILQDGQYMFEFILLSTPVNEVEIDNQNGLGQVPYNASIDYHGLRVMMRPSVYLSLAAPKSSPPSDYIIQHIKDGGSIGAPFLIIEIPEGMKGIPHVRGHEGRHRMEAVQMVEGDNPVEVHLLLRQPEVSIRARNITPEIIKYINKYLDQEITGSTRVGPFFTIPGANISEDGRVVKGVNTTADVQPGETQRQAAKFGNKIGKDGQPPLLNAKARKNSTPHVLDNLGLAEAKLNELFDGPYEWHWKDQNDSVWRATATTDDGGRIGMEFGNVGNGRYYVDFIRNGSQNVTGEGDAFKVFATVLDALKELISAKNPKSIFFSAEKNPNRGQKMMSRINLYKRLVNRFASQHGFDVDIRDTQYDTKYILTKKGLTESKLTLNPNYNQERGNLDHIVAQIERYIAGNNLDRFVRTVPVQALNGTQDWLDDHGGGDPVFPDIDEDYWELPVTALVDDQLIVIDGHHRASQASGQIEVLVFPIRNDSDLAESRQVNELFDKKYNWRWVMKASDDFEAEFDLDDGQTIHVYFVAASRGGTHWDVGFKKGVNVKRTGEGDQFAIFATVMDIWKSFLKERPDVESFSFVAKREGDAATSPKIKDSRVSLYNRMLSRFADQIGFEYASDQIGRMTEFQLRKKQDVTEAIVKPAPEDTLGVDRADMPQVAEPHYPELMDYLEDHGVTRQTGKIDARKLKAVQHEFSDEGVEKMMSKKGGDNGTTREKPLLVSQDNYIIDGHHRWLAAYNLGETIPIIRFSTSVKELLKLVREFPHTTYKDLYNENMSITGTETAQKGRDLEPGTEAWFKHWFSRPRLTREEVDFLKQQIKGVRNEKATKRRGPDRN